MTNGVRNRRKHIVATGTSVAEPFKPRLGRGNAKLPPIPDRATHGDALKKQLDRAWRDLAERDATHDAVAVDARRGIYLEFASAPGFELALKSLEAKGAGIALAASRVKNDVQYATVYVPAGQLGYFEKKVAAYLTTTRDNGKPANKTLVESIAEIRLAALEGFWTDEPGLFPAQGQTIWWEVWLRKDGDTTRKRFADYATNADIKVGDKYLEFPDRLVVLAYGTREQMTDSVELVDVIAELRLAKEVPTRFLEMGTVEAAQWAKDLVTRIVPPPSTAPAVCILDTGLNAAHPLLEAAVPPNGVHTYHPTWGVIDKHGHGTEMAGIALFGDLTESLLISSPAALSHWIESVKILHHAIPNPPELYGVITAESVARAEQAAPERNRAISLSIATKEFRDRGQPSSWSAEIDKLCAGGDGAPQRLFLVCAGNIEENAGKDYPAQNLTEGIHDPGQSWNAVTVGAFTNRTRIDDPAFDGWTPVARAGELSPTSSTSCIWDSQWPIKPEIVMEGGNMALSPSGDDVTLCDSLSLLTTYYMPLVKPFVSTGETSAATAGAARIAAMIWAEYPTFWPETMRALLVHSAEWTRPMREQIEQSSGVRGIESLLRCFGFGVPDLERALWSAGNALTLVVQDSLQPFERDTTNEMKLHALPWPVQELLQLGETMVELRVTLSYFIEPNPARRGWIRRHRYASHGLRFAMQAPTEALDEFRKRVNRAARAENESISSSVDEGWTFGPNLRHKGSIHHDRWEGTAADLALRQHIAIYPATGWWSERHHLGRWKNDVRYVLVVSIRTPETDVDIYQAVANKVKVGATIAI